MFARRAAGENIFPVGLEPGEEIDVAEQSVFGDLGIAGAELALRQRVEQRGIGEHQDRLMEGADQILAVLRIDAGLAADRGIDLRQQRGRHLDEIEAAPHARRREAREIADHAAAERDDEIVALDPRRDQRLADVFEYRRSFFEPSPAGTMTCDTPMPAASSDVCAAGEMRAPDILVGDDRGARARPQRRHARSELREHAAADHDVIGAVAERDIDDDRIVRSAAARSWRFLQARAGIRQPRAIDRGFPPR